MDRIELLLRLRIKNALDDRNQAVAANDLEQTRKYTSEIMNYRQRLKDLTGKDYDFHLPNGIRIEDEQQS